MGREEILPKWHTAKHSSCPGSLLRKYNCSTSICAWEGMLQQNISTETKAFEFPLRCCLGTTLDWQINCLVLASCTAAIILSGGLSRYQPEQTSKSCRASSRQGASWLMPRKVRFCLPFFGKINKPLQFLFWLHCQAEINTTYVKTADPEGFRGISVFHYFPRFNKFQTSLWRRESHHTTLHMHSPSQPNNLFCGKALSIKKCQVMGALETWSLLTDMLQASPRAPDSLLCVCFLSCKPELRWEVRQ